MILINGASGYIGRALVAGAAKNGFQTRCMVRSADGQQRLLESLDPDLVDDLEIVILDTSGGEAVPETALSGISVVINCAGAAHTGSQNLASYSINATGVETFAETCARAGIAHFIQLSSIKVYGSDLEVINLDSVAKPDTAYGKSKLQGDLALQTISETDPMKVSVLRFPLVYGGDPRGNLARFRRAAEWRLPLPLEGLSNRRSLLARSALVDLILHLAEDTARSDRSIGSYRILLVADPQPYSTPEIFRASCQEAGVRCRMLSATSLLGRLFQRMAVAVGVAEQLYGNLVVDLTDTAYPAGWEPPPGLLNSMQTVSSADGASSRRHS